MDITVTDETENRIEFDVEGTTPAFMNALRRVMIGELPTLAVEELHVSKNNSGLFDEILAHRIGLLPWTFDEDGYVPRDECDCEDGCPDCTVNMALQKEGEQTVTAGDISAPADDVEPVNPDTVIVDLKEDAELDIEMDAVLGRGKDHAKWQAANASYAYDEEDDTFHVTVESVSGLAPRTIVSQAIDTLEAGVEEFADAVSN